MTATKPYNGTVTKINSKEIANQSDIDKEYGYKHKLYMEVDGEFFCVGSGKQPNIAIQINGKYESLNVGDKIQFVHTESEFGGKVYKHVKRSTINIIERNAAPPQPKAMSKAAAPVANASFEAGVAVGHAINCAVQLVRDGKGKVDLTKIESVSKDILLLSHKLKGEYADIIAPKKAAKEDTPFKEAADAPL